MYLEKIKTVYNLDQRVYKLRSTDWAVMCIFCRRLYKYGLSLLMNRRGPVMVAMYLCVHLMPLDGGNVPLLMIIHPLLTTQCTVILRQLLSSRTLSSATVARGEREGDCPCRWSRRSLPPPTAPGASRGGGDRWPPAGWGYGA